MSDADAQLDGRIGNVAAAVLEAELGEAASAAWDWAGRLVHERLWVGPAAPSGCAQEKRVDDAESPLASLCCVLEASEAPYLLLVGSGIEIESALALLAWPATDMVVPSPQRLGDSASGLYRSEAVLPEARKLLKGGVRTLEPLFEALGGVAASFSA